MDYYEFYFSINGDPKSFEIADVVSNQQGWEPSLSTKNTCFKATKGKSYFECRPLMVIGVATMVQATALHCAMQQNADIGALVYQEKRNDMTDKQYLSYLRKRRAEIEQDILAWTATPRGFYRIYCKFVNKYRIMRLELAPVLFPPQDLECIFLQELIEDLCESGAMTYTYKETKLFSSLS